MPQDKPIELTYPIVPLSVVNEIDNTPYKHKTIPLDGKLITAEDPLVIGKNFKTYTNMRPTATHPKAIGGMGKINATSTIDAVGATYIKARSAFHYRKEQPAESHILTQGFNAALTASQVLDCTLAIGSNGDFDPTELFTDTGTVTAAKFSEAPGGQVVYCNGTDTCLWAGREMPVGAFITSTAAITTGGATSPRDYTEIINNNKSTSSDIALVGGGIDTYTKLIIHAAEADGTAGVLILDSETSPKTITANGDAQVDTSYAKFGTGSVLFDGTGDYLSLTDHADWNFEAGAFTVDFWLRTTSSTAGICGQYVDEDNFWIIFLSGSRLGIQCKSGGTTVVYQITGSALSNLDRRFHHYAVSRTANTINLFFDGVLQSINAGGTQISGNMPDLNALLTIGMVQSSGVTTYLTTGWIDEFRLSKGIARWSASFTVASRPYYAAPLTWLIGSVRPIKGIKYYVSFANQVASTQTGSTWNGTTWEPLTITDNTKTAGISMATTGWVTFSSTVGFSRPKYIEGYFLYWYQFSLDVGSEAEIYYITIDAPFQQISDIWDGVERNIAIAYLYKTSYVDCTTQLYSGIYDSTVSSTFLELDSLTSSQHLFVGFFERTCAVNITTVPDHSNAASTNNTNLTVYYHDGNDWVSVGSVYDGTVEGTGVSLSKPGVISWTPPLPEQEFKKSISNGIPLYYYKFVWSETLDADCQIYYITGIPAQRTLDNYVFPLYTQNRLLLCGNVNQKKNSIIYSSLDTAQVFNGDDSGELQFGDETSITCGCSIFTQFGSNLYNLSLLFKDTETWALTYIEDKWIRYRITDNIGCPSPQTITTTILPPTKEIENLNRYVAVWQANNGIYISDGRAPICISKDISDRFDRSRSTCINQAYIRKFVGFMDEHNQEYHWLYCNGTPADTTTPLNKEMVFSFKEWKWYEIDRTTGKYLQFGIPVQDTLGNSLSYGFIDTGYMEALEWLNASAGTIKTFDSADITCTIETGDFTMEDGTFHIETQVYGAMLIQTAKLTTTANATMTHYVDTKSSGTTVTYDPTSANYRLAFPFKEDASIAGLFHGFKFVMATNNEAIAFEPLLFNITYQDVRDHDYERNW